MTCKIEQVLMAFEQALRQVRVGTPHKPDESSPRFEGSPTKLAYRPAEAGEAMGLSTGEIMKMLGRGDLGFVKRGRATLIPRAVIVSWLEQNTRYNTTTDGERIEDTSTAQSSKPE